jgi:hypothetical protein
LGLSPGAVVLNLLVEITMRTATGISERGREVFWTKIRYIKIYTDFLQENLLLTAQKMMQDCSAFHSCSRMFVVEIHSPVTEWQPEQSVHL